MDEFTSEKKICPKPWISCDIHHDGKMGCCCTSFCGDYVFGDLTYQSFEEVWNSAKAKYFRNKILKGDYSLCDLDRCIYKKRISADEIKRDFYDENGNVKYPKEMLLASNRECNVACITCRDCVEKNDKASDIERLNDIYNKIQNALNNLELLSHSGSGDPFASKWSRDFLKEVAKNNKNLKFHIMTNGVLMTKELCQEMGIYGRIYIASISLPGATEETYNKIVKYGNHKKVIENLEWLSKEEDIEYKTINFVIHKLNYKEIPQIIEIAERYNFNLNFIRYIYFWGTKYGKIYGYVEVWLPENPEYDEFVKVMNTDIVKKYKDCFDDFLKKFIQ